MVLLAFFSHRVFGLVGLLAHCLLVATMPETWLHILVFTWRVLSALSHQLGELFHLSFEKILSG